VNPPNIPIEAQAHRAAAPVVAPYRRRAAAVVRTTRLGVIEHIDARAVRLLNCPLGQASGRFLLSFVDPVSQRQFLDDLYRARRSRQAVTCALFVRPRRALPVRCQATVTWEESAAGGLCWSFTPLPEDKGEHGARARGERTAAALEGREHATRRIARDLHDDAGQILAALHLAIDDVGRSLSEPSRSRVLEMRHLVHNVEEQLRQISHEMRPPALEDLGVASALETLAAGVEARSGLRVTVKAPFRSRLDPAAETHVYRIAQEALGNVVRHAGARRARVNLEARGESAVLTVADDGVGFDVAALLRSPSRGLGLIGIQERVEAVRGTLSVHSSPGKGTTLVVTVPRRS
jgi:signal transduction histidine kinase